MVEAEQPHALLFGLLFELLYLERLYEKAAATLLPVRVLGPPHVDDDPDAAVFYSDQRPCTLLRIRLSGVVVNAVQIPGAYLECQTYCSQKRSERYLAAPSQRMVTTVPDSISLATSSAVATAAPAEMPMRIPSSRATRLTIS